MILRRFFRPWLTLWPFITYVGLCGSAQKLVTVAAYSFPCLVFHGCKIALIDCNFGGEAVVGGSWAHRGLLRGERLRHGRHYGECSLQTSAKNFSSSARANFAHGSVLRGALELQALLPKSTRPRLNGIGLFLPTDNAAAAGRPQQKGAFSSSSSYRKAASIHALQKKSGLIFAGPHHHLSFSARRAKATTKFFVWALPKWRTEPEDYHPPCLVK